MLRLQYLQSPPALGCRLRVSDPHLPKNLRLLYKLDGFGGYSRKPSSRSNLLTTQLTTYGLALLMLVLIGLDSLFSRVNIEERHYLIIIIIISIINIIIISTLNEVSYEQRIFFFYNIDEKRIFEAC